MHQDFEKYPNLQYQIPIIEGVVSPDKQNKLYGWFITYCQKLKQILKQQYQSLI